MELEENGTLLQKLDESEILLFSLMAEVEKILKLFSKNMAITMGSLQQLDQILPDLEEKEIEEAYYQASKKMSFLSQKLKEVTRELPLEIPKQNKDQNCRNFQCQNMALIIENYISEINSVIEKEKQKFPNNFQFSNNILDP